MMKVLLCIVLLGLVATEAIHKSYKGYKVYNVTPQTDAHLQLLSSWQQMEGVDFWDGFHKHTAIRIMFEPDQQSTFENDMSRWDVPSSVLIENVEQTFMQERRANFLNLRAAGNTSNFNRFWTLDEIYEYAEDLAQRFTYVNTVNLTKTSEGRVLKAVTIAANGTVGKNPVVLIDAGIHAREWAAVMSAVYLLRQLTENVSENPELLKVDWVILPVANPDGYVYSHARDRMWRKNRSPQKGGCYGVDLNRNFGLEWHPASGTECTLTFPGTKAFSEVESRAISDLVTKYSASLHTYLAIHTYGNYVLYPYGYSFDNLISNWEEHHAVGDQFASAVKNYSGRKYRVGNSAALLYTAYGASDDYVASRGARFAYTLELTGGGSTGFDLPAHKMGEVAAETFEGFKVIAQNVMKTNL